jgi:isochorismate synthase
MDFKSFTANVRDHFRKKKPFVIYKKPFTSKMNCFLQNNDQLDLLENYGQSGFVFAPFEEKGKKVVFLSDNSEFFEVEWTEEMDLMHDTSANPEMKEDTFNDRQSYIDNVEKCITYIRESACTKIVFSRKQIVHHKIEDILVVFERLIVKYPSAFCYVWFHPKIGCWMGASPEKLIKTFGNHFETMALAGTQKYVDNKNIVWQVKEKEEQQLVTDYILRGLGSKVTAVSEPFTLKAGTLLHICSKIEGELAEGDDLQELVERLHPTPAVCGLPKILALDFLHENEGYDRAYYTGFLGELNTGEGKCSAELFVNLRCMQIFPEQIEIYVGGGITSKSIADKEWEETVAKTMTMLSVLS